MNPVIFVQSALLRYSKLSILKLLFTQSSRSAIEYCNKKTMKFGLRAWGWPEPIPRLDILTLPSILGLDNYLVVIYMQGCAERRAHNLDLYLTPPTLGPNPLPKKCYVHGRNHLNWRLTLTPPLRPIKRNEFLRHLFFGTLLSQCSPKQDMRTGEYVSSSCQCQDKIP